MIRFAARVMGLVLALSMLIDGAMLIGISNPALNDLQTKGFDTCGGKPCFLGIIAGVTSREDAYALLQKQGRDPVVDEINGTILVNGLKLTQLDDRLLIEDRRGLSYPLSDSL